MTLVRPMPLDTGAYVPAHVQYEPKVLPAPVNGLSTSKAEALPAPGYAQVLENGVPTQKGVRVRGGLKSHRPIGTKAVRSFMVYLSGTTRQMFAASSTSIFNVSAAGATAPAAVVSSMTSGDWISANISTPGGQFLIAVNGSDAIRQYDGTTWASNSPAITFAAPFAAKTTALLNFVWLYGSRLWFIEKNSLTVWYLPNDSIGGELARFSLGGIFKRGGSLVLGGTWSNETGSSLNARIVFVSSEGEAAVYEGSNPADATNWRLVGVYDVGSPLGKRAALNIGGELHIATRNGLVPLQSAVTKSPETLSLANLSYEINEDWRKSVSGNFTFATWPEKGILIGGSASTVIEGATDSVAVKAPVYAANLETVKWGKWTGWDMQSATYFNGKVYIGSSNGKVYEAESSGSDDGVAYYFRLADWWGDESRNYKTVAEARPTFVYTQPFRAQITFATDYKIKWPAPGPTAPNLTVNSRWDAGTAKWDDPATIWDEGLEKKVSRRWKSIGRSGYVHALLIQVTINNESTPDFEYVVSDVTIIPGALVV